MKSTFQGLKMKFYWKTVTPLSIIYGCFHSAMAELEVEGETLQPTECNIFTIWPIAGSLPTPDLRNCLPRESAFSYIDSYGPKEIRYFQRARMSLFPCVPLDSLLSFPSYSAVPEKVVHRCVSLTLFLKDFF